MLYAEAHTETLVPQEIGSNVLRDCPVYCTRINAPLKPGTIILRSFVKRRAPAIPDLFIDPPCLKKNYNESIHHRFVPVHAGGGWSKSTMLSSFVRSSDHLWTWLNTDAGDKDHGTYFLNVLNGVQQTVGQNRYLPLHEQLKIKKLNLKTRRANHIRLNFQELYLQPAREAAAFPNRWYFWATLSRLEPIIKAARTIKRHWNAVLRWFTSKMNKTASWMG